MQVQTTQNNNLCSPYFKGQVRYILGKKNVIEKTVTRAEDEILNDLFLKATHIDCCSYRYGDGLKNTNYYTYLNRLKEILNIDFESIAKEDFDNSYDYFYSNDIWIKNPLDRISVNKADDSAIEHEFDFIYKGDFRTADKERNKSRENYLELSRRADLAKQWAACEHEPSELSRELQIVHKLLNLAEHKGKDRFNSAEVNELTGSAKMYESKIPVIDLIKQLLNIGIEKGEPLSAQEIKDFLTVTALMSKKEQTKVIAFMKSLKENASADSKEDCVGKTGERHQLAQGKPDTSKFINLNNLQVVYGITKCYKPEIMAIIANRTGITDELKSAPDLFVEIYEMSNGNLDLLQDLTRCFYLSEIDQIFSQLKTKVLDELSKYTSKTYSTDYHSYSFTPPAMSSRRNIVIEALGLTGKVDLCKLDTYREVPTYRGNFERSERNRKH